MSGNRRQNSKPLVSIETAIWRIAKKRNVLLNDEEYVLAKEMLLKRQTTEPPSKRVAALMYAVEAYENPDVAKEYIRPPSENKLPNPENPLIVKLTYDEIYFLNEVCVRKEFNNKDEYLKGKELLLKIQSKILKGSQENITCLYTLIALYEKAVEPVKEAFPCRIKTAWDTKSQAREALKKIRLDNETTGRKRKYTPIRSYECNFCGKYHLTCKPLFKKVKEEVK